MYISTPEQLSACVNALSKLEVIFLDTEFLREKTYFPKLCLIQIGSRDEQYVIDPLALEDLSALIPLLTDKNLVKVFHACTQDVEVLFQRFGVTIGPLFDTQVAAAFLGKSMQIGYASLVHDVCGVDLAKTESLTDWSLRPLDANQIKYALDDIKYLPQIYDWEIAELTRLGRLDWVWPEIEQVLQTINYQSAPEAAYKKVKRIHGLTRRQLGVAQSVAAWRERRAVKLDIPRRWVLSDEVVVEIAKRMPKGIDRLARIRGVGDSLSAHELETLFEACEAGLEIPTKDLPKQEHITRPSKESESVGDLMYALLRLISDDTGIATPMLSSRSELLSLESDGMESRLMQSWRRELIGERLLRLLRGELALTVQNGSVKIASS